MKRLKQAVAVLVWCAVSVGCVAEVETPPSKFKEPDKLVIENLKSRISLNNSVRDVSYQCEENNCFVEIQFSGEITNIVHECRKDGLCSVFFDGIAVEFGGAEFGLHNTYRRVVWPKTYKRGMHEEYIGNKADVYCRLKPEWDWKKMIGVEGFDGIICSIADDEKYFLKIN